jgi:hypothetical protein
MIPFPKNENQPKCQCPCNLRVTEPILPCLVSDDDQALRVGPLEANE